MLTSIVASFVTSKYFSNANAGTMIFVSTACRTLSFLTLYIAFIVPNLNVGFWMSIASTALLGCFTSVDKLVFQTFLKDFPHFCFSSYSSGSGFSGLMGALILIFAPEIGLGFKYIALSLVPSNLVFLGLYLWMEYLRSCSNDYYNNNKEKKNLENKELLSKENDNDKNEEKSENDKNEKSEK